MLVACLIVAAIFGLTPILDKFILRSIDVETLMIMSGVLYGVVATLYAVFYHRGPFMDDMTAITANPVLLLLIAVSTVLIFIVANYLYLSVIRDHTTALATAITASYPLVTVVAGLLLFGEAISYEQFGGILLVIGGIFMLTKE
jgi:drug/metabolite transporter (DMT)-like permease